MDKKFYINASFTAKEVEKTKSGPLKIAGYANTVDKDRAGDIVLPDAWAKGIESYRKNPVLLYQHNHANPIGRVNKITVDKKGMYIEAAISEAAEKLHGVHSLIKDGALKSFSVGFMVKDGKHSRADDAFIISDVELLEISVVSVPANQESLFSIRKSFENDEQYEEFKKSFSSDEVETPEKKSEETPAEEVEIKDPYQPIPFVNLLNLDTGYLKTGQFIRLNGARYAITKIATSESPTFEFKEVDLQGQHLDKILNIDATSLEVLNIQDIDTKFDIHLAEIKSIDLDENNKKSILNTYKDLINLREKDLFDLKQQTTNPLQQTKLNKTINLVSTDTKNWADSDYQVAHRICQVIQKLKEIEQSEVSTLMLKLHGHLEAQTKEKLNMATQAVDEPVVIGSAAESKAEATATVKVAEPRVAELVQKTGEAIVKEADNKEKYGEYTPRESEEVAELRAQIKKFREEVASYQNSKMVFQEQSRAAQFTQREIANAYILSKALRKESPFDTKIGSRMKAVTSVDQFLSNFSTDIYTELQQELVVAKMLRRMAVDAKTFRVPVADEDADGDVAQFASGTYNQGITDNSRVPATNQHSISAVEFTPHKFMATTHLAKDEEEDTVLPLLDFLRTASMRRMGRAIDKALLRGDGSLSGFTASPTNAITPGTGYASVFKGIATLAADISGLRVDTTNSSTKVAPSNIASARAVLGKYGLQLGDHLVYLTTIEGYNALVTNSDFTTVDKFGPNATYLTGSLGAIYGIPVMITEFLDVVGGSNRHLGVLVYKPGFLVAERRAMEIESEYDPRRQLTAIYMSTRLDMKALTTNASAALDATKYPMAAVLRSGS